jgi:hypothetical protein
MPWLKIDDGFEDHPKVEPLSDAAHRLWMRAATWCRKPQNAHTHGFVPAAMLPTIAKRSAPLKKLLVLAQELADAKGGGMFAIGLWEVVDGGWQFHDWERYQPRNSTPEEEAELSAKRSNAGRKGAKARWANHGNTAGKDDSNLPMASMAKNASPSPSPSQSGDLQPQIQDLSGTQHPDPSSPPDVAAAAVPDERIRCPKLLDLDADERASVEIAGVPAWAIDELVGFYRAKFLSQEPRSPGAWKRSLVTAVIGGWRNAKTRPTRDQPNPAADPLEGWERA